MRKGGGGVKNLKKLMTSFVNGPFRKGPLINDIWWPLALPFSPCPLKKYNIIFIFTYLNPANIYLWYCEWNRPNGIDIVVTAPLRNSNRVHSLDKLWWVPKVKTTRENYNTFFKFTIVWYDRNLRPYMMIWLPTTFVLHTTGGFLISIV